MRGFAGVLRDRADPQIGTWLKLPSLEAVEIVASAGFDFAVIDLEHAPLDLATAYAMTVVAQGAGMSVLVRLPDRSGSHTQRLLDAGVDGLLVPRITGAEEARRACREMVFAPEGDRGMGLTARAGVWGGSTRDEYLATGEDVLRAVQIEDIDVLRNAAAIVDIPELSGVFLGMGDLQQSSGLTADDPEVRELVDTLLDYARATAVPVGTAVATAPQAVAAFERGFRFVMVDNDAGLLRGAAAALVETVRTR